MGELDIWARPVAETPHNFEWAMATLKAGGKVRRSTWHRGFYIYVKGNDLMYCSGRSESESGFVLEWHQISAIDWQSI